VFDVPVLIAADLRALAGGARPAGAARTSVRRAAWAQSTGRAHGGRPARAHRPHRPDIDLPRRRPS